MALNWFPWRCCEWSLQEDFVNGLQATPASPYLCLLRTLFRLKEWHSHRKIRRHLYLRRRCLRDTIFGVELLFWCGVYFDSCFAMRILLHVAWRSYRDDATRHLDFADMVLQAYSKEVWRRQQDVVIKVWRSLCTLCLHVFPNASRRVRFTSPDILHYFWVCCTCARVLGFSLSWLHEVSMRYLPTIRSQGILLNALFRFERTLFPYQQDVD